MAANNNKILDASNASIAVTNLLGGNPPSVRAMEGVPLGTVGASATGEVGAKVLVIGSTPPATGGTTLTPVSALVTTDSSVAAGAHHIDFIFSTDFTGTVNGIAYAGATDSVQSFDVASGFILSAIPYTITTGSIRIVSF